MALETWKSIPSEPGYEVSDLGRVRSTLRTIYTSNGHFRTYRSKILKPGRTNSGHTTVACGKGNSRSVHALVAEAFIGPRLPGMEVLHGDGLPGNNKLWNLRYGTRSENLLDNTKHGKNTLTTPQVVAIRARYVPRRRKNGSRAISREMGVKTYIVDSCLTGKNYA